MIKLCVCVCVCVCVYMRVCVRACALQVVFRAGEGALQVLPPLIDVIPEARLNLVIYYLRQGVGAAPPITATPGHISISIGGIFTL